MAARFTNTALCTLQTARPYPKRAKLESRNTLGLSDHRSSSRHKTFHSHFGLQLRCIHTGCSYRTPSVPRTSPFSVKKPAPQRSGANSVMGPRSGETSQNTIQCMVILTGCMSEQRGVTPIRRSSRAPSCPPAHTSRTLCQAAIPCLLPVAWLRVPRDMIIHKAAYLYIHVLHGEGVHMGVTCSELSGEIPPSVPPTPPPPPTAE
jgi:hypothetical protein